VIALTRTIVRLSARLVPAGHRARWQEEWLGELDAVRARGLGAALRFAAGAPRDAWSTRPPKRLFSAIGTDFHYAIRQVLRRPAYTVAVIACLVVGLVASVATFSVITSIFYGDMPGISQRRDIVRLYLSYDLAAGYETLPDGRHVVAEPFSFTDFNIARELKAAPAIDIMAAEGDLLMTATGHHGPLSVTGAFASGDFFRVMRTVPAAGRFFTGDDDRADAEPVAIVTDQFWRTQLDADPNAIGRPILAGGLSFTVVGVAPPRFHGMQTLDVGQDDTHGVQIWIPLAHAASWRTHPPLTDPWLTTVCRLKPGFTLQDAQQQMNVTAARIAAADPNRRANAAAVARPHGLGTDTPFRILLIVAMLMALPMTVLAIGCANVANLQLARAAERSRELAVRLALGATRAQLVRLLTIETLARVLVAIGVSIALISMLLARIQPLFPIFVTIDWRVMLFAVAIALLVALATGLVPAWLVLRRTAAGQLKQTAQSGGLGHSRLRGALVVSQVAMSLTLLVVTALFTRTVRNMISDAPPALREQIVASFNPAELRMSPVEASQFAATLAARAAADGRVSNVSLSMQEPVRFGLPTAPPVGDRFASHVGITSSWLDVMSVRMLAGRALNSSDDQSVAVISAYAAEMIAPSGSPLGSMLRVIGPGAVERRVRVVGIAADNPVRPTVARPDPVIYTNFPAELDGPFTLRLRSANPEALRPDLMRLINAVDARIAWTSIRRGDMAFEDDANEMRFAVYGSGLAAMVAVVLSATGLYAVMSYVVLLRRREIGVRVALGAAPSGIVALMLRQAFRLVGAGVGIGLALSIPLAILMQASLVARVSAADPLIFGPTILLLVIAGGLASAVPALRASRVDPIATLRQD
jgi:predicted permease